MTPQKWSSKAKLLIAATMVTLAVTCVTASATPAATTPSGLNQTVSVAHSSGDAGASTQVSISTYLYKTDGSTPSPTTEIGIQFPNGLVRNTGLFQTCSASTLTQQGPSACQTANVGYGSLTLLAGTTQPLYASVSAFNGTNNTLLLYVAPPLLNPFVLTGTPAGATLTFPIPAIATGQGNAAITQMFLNLGTGNYLVNPGTGCPYQYNFSFTYANNETLPSVPATASCPPLPPVFVFALSPKTAALTVGAQACVTAKFTIDGIGYDQLQVRFSVSGANAGPAGVVNTDTSGNAGFCYTGSKVGGDTITAHADYSEDGNRDEGEPIDTATVTFTAPAAVATAPPPKAKKKSCRVPKVRGLSLKKAKKKLKKAGCRYKIRGKGRVRSTSPSAGKRTTKTVLIKAKKGKRKRK